MISVEISTDLRAREFIPSERLTQMYGRGLNFLMVPSNSKSEFSQALRGAIFEEIAYQQLAEGNNPLHKYLFSPEEVAPFTKQYFPSKGYSEKLFTTTLHQVTVFDGLLLEKGEITQFYEYTTRGRDLTKFLRSYRAFKEQRRLFKGVSDEAMLTYVVPSDSGVNIYEFLEAVNPSDINYISVQRLPVSREDIFRVASDFYSNYSPDEFAPTLRYIRQRALGYELTF